MGRQCEQRFLDRIYSRYLENSPAVVRILAGEVSPGLAELMQGRNFPSQERHKDKDWWKMMLLRYGLAIHYATGKKVLDTCSGLGWGLYILADRVSLGLGVELDPRAVAFARENWLSSRLHFINGSVLAMPVADRRFEMVLAFESIEHFSRADSETYLKEIYRVLQPGGLVIGSSYFPDTRVEADRVCAQNKHHRYIFCRDEFKRRLLATGFRRPRIFRNRFFFMARR